MSAIHEELLRIYERDGYLRPEQVVQEATDPTNPLHTHFEWDNDSAAQKYRVNQAARLIRGCRFTFIGGDEQTFRLRSWLSVPTDDLPSYVPTETALSESEKRTLVFQQLRRDIAALRRKYQGLTEFETLVRNELLGEAGEVA